MTYSPEKNVVRLPLGSREDILEAGCDEAGRGCLAGPVYAAAVILNPDCPVEGLDDSKKLSAAARRRLRKEIEDKSLAWGVGVVTAGEIDRINILQASVTAMHRAIDALAVRPQAIAVDGNYFRPYGTLPWRTFVKGDGRFANIAAASILAKTHRDEYMEKIAEEYPVYGWKGNKGYPTAAHREAIARYGPSPIHRMSFKLLPDPCLDFGDF